MNDFNWGQFFLVGIVALVIGGIISTIFFQPKIIGLSEEEVNSSIEAAVAEMDIRIKEKDVKIDELNSKIVELENTTKVIVDGEGKNVTVIEKTLGYLVDELFLEIPFDDEFSDRELNIFDDEIEFNGKDYDAEEVFTFEGLELLANEEDFDGNVYLTFPKEGLSYAFIFESSLNTSKIGEDKETLVFDLLGEEVEISKWENNEVTFTHGEKYLLSETESITIDGKTIELAFVLNDAAYVIVDGEGEKIREGRVRNVNGIEIKTLDVLYRSGNFGGSKATLIIGEEVETTINDKDEYSEDSIWEWRITENIIGLTLSEEFKELDEDFSALEKEELICLPNDYLCVVYNGITKDSTEEYTFEIDGNHIELVGNLLKGIEDYKKVFVNITGIYDKNFVLIDNESIGLGDTDSVLNITTNRIIINDVNLSYSLDNVWDNSLNISSKDENYLTTYGILIDNPENSVEEKHFTLKVPEERLEGSVTIVQGKPKEA